MSEEAKAALANWLNAAGPDALTGDPHGVAVRAFDAGMRHAASIARAAEKRYTCKKMRDVCTGIGDSIMREVGDE